LSGQRLDPKTDGRPDPRPSVRENYPLLGDLVNDFDFSGGGNPGIPRRLILPEFPITPAVDSAPIDANANQDDEETLPLDDSSQNAPAILDQPAASNEQDPAPANSLIIPGRFYADNYGPGVSSHEVYFMADPPAPENHSARPGNLINYQVFVLPTGSRNTPVSDVTSRAFLREAILQQDDGLQNSDISLDPKIS
jgi:hypothetical protein